MNRLQLYQIEKIVLAFALLALGLYGALGIPLRPPLGLYWERLREGGVLYVTGLLIAALLIRLTRRSFREEYFRFRLIARDLRLIHSFALTFVVFLELKHLIPHINPRLWDEWAITSERSLLGGKLASEWIRFILPPETAPLISSAYMFFYPFLAVVIIYSVVQRDESFAKRFAAAFSLVWFLGILLVYAAPTLGPCFAIPGFNDALPPTEVTEAQRQLLLHKVYVETHPESTKGIWLISGFPSLHLAVPVLATVAFWRHCRLACAFSLFTAAATVVSTLYFGWHYLLDDAAAVALGALCWTATRPKTSTTAAR